MGDQIVGPQFMLDVLINRSCIDYGVTFPVAINLLSCAYSMILRSDTNDFLSHLLDTQCDKHNMKQLL